MKLVPSTTILLTALALVACGDTTSTEDATEKAAIDSADPWFVLAALPPEAQPYGRDVYREKCLHCHGDLGQGVEGNPPLKRLAAPALNARLLEYRAGTVSGEQAAVMHEALAGMSDAEIAAVALYAAG